MLHKISGKHIDIGDSLRTHVEDKINDAVEKYFGQGIDSVTAITQDRHLYQVQCSVHIGHGIHIQGHGSADAVYPAVDSAIERIAKQLRRYKRRLKDHHADQRSEEKLRRAYHVVLSDQDGDEEGEAPLHPIVVAESTTNIPVLTVSEAVMRMDLEGTNTLVFINKAHEGVNVVYRRQDGNIGWVDPSYQGNNKKDYDKGVAASKP